MEFISLALACSVAPWHSWTPVTYPDSVGCGFVWRHAVEDREHGPSVDAIDSNRAAATSSATNDIQSSHVALKGSVTWHNRVENISPRVWTGAFYAAVLAYIIASSAHERGFIFDDPFIFFRYARNLAHGYGWVYNVGHLVMTPPRPPSM